MALTIDELNFWYPQSDDLGELDLRICELTDADMPILAEFLKKNPKITTLNVSNVARTHQTPNSISSAGLRVLLADNQTLSNLNISQITLSDEDASFLAGHPTLTVLIACGNNLSPGAIMNLVANPRWTDLILGNNKIGDEGAAILATHPNLIRLFVGNNGISDLGASFLAASESIRRLCIGKNPITSVGAKILISADFEMLYINENIGADVIAALKERSPIVRANFAPVERRKVPSLVRLSIYACQNGIDAASEAFKMTNFTLNNF